MSKLDEYLRKSREQAKIWAEEARIESGGGRKSKLVDGWNEAAGASLSLLHSQPAFVQ